MAPGSKTPEEWIAFLLVLIEHTKDFKPDWEGFAQNTGLYKRGKFVQQAYNSLRQKYAAGQFVKQSSDAPATPKTPTKGSAQKRKVAEANEDDYDDEGLSKPSSDKKKETKKLKVATPSKKKKKSAVTKDKAEDNSDNDGQTLNQEGKGQGADIENENETISVKDEDVDEISGGH